VVIQGIAAGAAAVAAMFSYWAVKGLRKQTNATILLTCLQSYLDVRRTRVRATQDKSKGLAYTYYRELFDLHCSEYNLWRRRLIDQEVTKMWIIARRRDFQKDQIVIQDDGEGSNLVSYSDVWQQLLETEYFHPSDPFVEFMNRAHKGEIDAALRNKT